MMVSVNLHEGATTSIAGHPFIRDFGSRDMLVALLILLLTFLLCNLWDALISIWWKPLRIKKVFESQGVPCLPPSHYFYGNFREYAAFIKEAHSHPMPNISHDIGPRILPHYYQWRRKYGEKFVWWFGSDARFFLPSPEYAKEVMSTKFKQYPKPEQRPDTVRLVTNGLVNLEGDKWAVHRQIMNPAFFQEKLKAMLPTMAACALGMIEKWDIAREIDVHVEFKCLTADIIAHTGFGTSFAEGKKVFELQYDQQVLANKILNSIYIPGARFLPTPLNRYRWKLDKGIDTILRQLIEQRLDSVKVGRADSYGNDLLGLMIAANKSEAVINEKTAAMTIDGMIGECKTFFFAGHETTSNLLTWTFLLLATSPEWQERTRAEVQAVYGMTEAPAPATVNHLKIMGMVFNEALRLYPPAIFITRQASRDMQLENMMIPKGTVLQLPILPWHHEEKYWGPDVHEFHPERFGDGIARACKVTGAYMPFSMGPRVCIGQNFAIYEAKVALVIILQRYRFRLSSTYRHAPITVLTLQPKFGMPIIFEKL